MIAPGAPGGISCNASRIAAAPPSSIAAESAADCAPFSGRPRRGVDDRATGVSGTLAASFDSARARPASSIATFARSASLSLGRSPAPRS